MRAPSPMALEFALRQITWTGEGAPASDPKYANGDYYIDEIEGLRYEMKGGLWVETGGGGEITPARLEAVEDNIILTSGVEFGWASMEDGFYDGFAHSDAFTTDGVWGPGGYDWPCIKLINNWLESITWDTSTEPSEARVTLVLSRNTPDLVLGTDVKVFVAKQAVDENWDLAPWEECTLTDKGSYICYPEYETYIVSSRCSLPSQGGSATKIRVRMTTHNSKEVINWQWGAIWGEPITGMGEVFGGMFGDLAQEEPTPPRTRVIQILHGYEADRMDFIPRDCEIIAGIQLDGTRRLYIGDGEIAGGHEVAGTGLKGDKGDPGEDGATGPQGEPGEPADVGILPPVGTIVSLHHLAPAPDSDYWTLCDGKAWPTGSFTTTGTVPNLTDDRFLRGNTAAGQGGGTASLAAANIPSHRHSIGHNHALVYTNYITPSGCAGPSRYYGKYLSTGGCHGYARVSCNNPLSADPIVEVSHRHSVDLPNFAGNSGYYGSGSAFSVVPKYFNVKYYIRYK